MPLMDMLGFKSKSACATTRNANFLTRTWTHACCRTASVLTLAAVGISHFAFHQDKQVPLKFHHGTNNYPSPSISTSVSLILMTSSAYHHNLRTCRSTQVDPCVRKSAWLWGGNCVLSNSIPLAECKGPVFGQSSSHYAKATAILSGAHFAHHLVIFTHSPFPIRFEHFSDNNKGLITRINQRYQHVECYPTITLAPN
jgi:hypothetical protein